MRTYAEREQRRKAKDIGSSSIMVMCLALLLASGVVTAVGKLLWSPRFDKGVVAWGKESNGLQAGLEITSVGSDLVVCQFHLKNTSDEIVRIDGSYPVYRAVQIADQDSPFPPVSGFADQSYMCSHAIKPGETWFRGWWISLSDWRLEVPYRVQLCWIYRNSLPPDQDRWENREPRGATYQNIWIGEVRSGWVHYRAGTPWYGHVLSLAIVFGMIYLVLWGWQRYKHRRFGGVTGAPTA